MKKIKFTLPAEALGSATSVVLLGDFNDWNLDKGIELSVQADGSLAASVALEPGKTYEYRFLLSNGTWINDWNAQQYVHNQVFGVENSVITVPAAASKKAPAKTEKAAPAKAAAKKAAPSKPKKEKAAVALSDDLTKIEGIGNKIAKILLAEGIDSFAALGKATSKKLKGILEKAGSDFQMHNPASWPKQAKLAAAGKWDELAALQQKLVAGK
ncbi:helix-hairpin-helix domain-containing protein [Niabella insulamsoli]|uniref:helix-hairpin-helix domain-containing protein n=1 Tax=Niabella insulamsoli TaxID=3144874 RepID=UPI0031FC0D94